MKKILLLLIFLTSIYSIGYSQCTNAITSGIISGDQTICYNSFPATIRQVVAPINVVGTESYFWETSTNGIDWSKAPVAVNATYSFPSTLFPYPLIEDIYLRRSIIDSGTPAPCNVATSNVVHITVLPQLTAGIIESDETICAGAPTTVMTQSVMPNGGIDTYSYQWQSSTSGTFGTFTNISGATNPSYDALQLNTTTYYQQVVTSGNCGTIISNVVTKTVTAAEAITVSINDPGQVCLATLSTFTATVATSGTGTLSYQWYLGAIPVGSNSAFYTSTSQLADDGKILQVAVSTTGCNYGPVTSNPVTLDIVPISTPTVTISTIQDTECAGFPTLFTATSTGYGSAPIYQWYILPAGASKDETGIPAGTNSTTFISTLTDGQQVYLELTSNLVCIVGTPQTYRSNTITMNIKPIPRPKIVEGDQTICSPDNFTFHGVIFAGNTCKWISMPSNTVVSTDLAFTATESGTYTLVEDNDKCNSPSIPVVLTVIPTPIANAGPDQYVLAGTLVTLNASGGNEYSWVPSTYLSNTTIANPTFTADQTITYTVTVSNRSETTTCLTEDDVTVHVTNAPAGSFSTTIIGPNPITSGQQNVVYSVPNQTDFTYTWSITGGTIVSGQNTNSVMVDWDAPASNSFARTTAETYSISVLEKNKNNQTKTTTATINTITTGTTLSQSQAGINVFPNPTTGSFSIAMPESGVDVTYEILDVTGLSVASGIFTSTGSDQKIEAHFRAGMYQVILKYNNVVACVRLSKIQ